MIRSVPSSVTKILICLQWLLQETRTVNSTLVFMSVLITPRGRELFGAISFSFSPVSRTIDSGMHVTITPVSTLPLITSGLRVWNMTLARTSRTLTVSMERTAVSYDVSYAPSFESVSDTSAAFWLLSLPFTLFLSSTRHLKMTYPMTEVALRLFSWAVFTRMLVTTAPSESLLCIMWWWSRHCASWRLGFWLLLHFSAISLRLPGWALRVSGTHFIGFY